MILDAWHVDMTCRSPPTVNSWFEVLRSHTICVIKYLTYYFYIICMIFIIKFILWCNVDIGSRHQLKSIPTNRKVFEHVKSCFFFHKNRRDPSRGIIKWWSVSGGRCAGFKVRKYLNFWYQNTINISKWMNAGNVVQWSNTSLVKWIRESHKCNSMSNLVRHRPQLKCDFILKLDVTV